MCVYISNMTFSAGVLVPFLSWKVGNPHPLHWGQKEERQPRKAIKHCHKVNLSSIFILKKLHNALETEHITDEWIVESVWYCFYFKVLFSKTQEEKWTRMNMHDETLLVFKLGCKIFWAFWKQRFIASTKVKINARNSRTFEKMLSSTLKSPCDILVKTIKNNSNTKQAQVFRYKHRACLRQLSYYQVRYKPD